jgi:AcrR family transcriptional regulator
LCPGVVYATGGEKVTHNRGVSEDLRVRRTRKLLQEALIELTVEKGFSAVTVRDIAARAMVNRATFYRHYQDKYDLLNRYMDDLYAMLDSPDEVATLPGVPEKPPAGLVRMLEHVQAHADFYRVMLGKRGDPAFSHRIRGYIEKRMRASLSAMMEQDHAHRLASDLCLRYISSAGVGAIEWWLENDLPYSAEQMATLAVQLSMVDVRFFLHGHL